MKSMLTVLILAAWTAAPALGQSVGDAAEAFVLSFEWIPCKIIEIDQSKTQPYYVEYIGSNSWAGRKQWVERVQLRPAGTPGKAPPPDPRFGGVAGTPIPFGGSSASSVAKTNSVRNTPQQNAVQIPQGYPHIRSGADAQQNTGKNAQNTAGLIPHDSGLSGSRPKSKVKPTKFSDIFGLYPQNIIGTWAMSSGGVWNPVGDPKLNGQGRWEQVEEYGMPTGAGVLRVNDDGTWLYRFAGKTQKGRWLDSTDTVHVFGLNGQEYCAWWNSRGWLKLQDPLGLVLEGVKL